MVQICVVNCFSCHIFQGQQAQTKGKTWTCKMCGEKQAFRQIFAQGSGKECRPVVQKLNMIRGNIERKLLDEASHQPHQNETAGIDADSKETTSRCSKWSQFVPSGPPDAETAETTDKNSTEFSCTTERETFDKYRRAKRKNNVKAKGSENHNASPQTKIQKLDFEIACVNVEEKSQTSEWNQFVACALPRPETETISKNSSSSATERKIFNKYRAVKNKRTMKAKESDCLNVLPQSKMEKNYSGKAQYPSKTSQAHLEDADDSGNIAFQTLLPLELENQRLLANKEGCQKKAQKGTVAQAPKVSKWSKYIQLKH